MGRPLALLPHHHAFSWHMPAAHGLSCTTKACCSTHMMMASDVWNAGTIASVLRLHALMELNPTLQLSVTWHEPHEHCQLGHHVPHTQDTTAVSLMVGSMLEQGIGLVGQKQRINRLISGLTRCACPLRANCKKAVREAAAH